MILFAARPPLKDKAIEGMAARVCAIDALYSQEERHYVEVIDEYTSGRPEKNTIRENLVAWRLNVRLPSHCRVLRSLLDRASLVYIHSIYNVPKLLPFLSDNVVVIDIHGAVPEEEKRKGNRERSVFYANIERLIIERSYKVVAVSEAMIEHLGEKGYDLKGKAILLPIFGAGNVRTGFVDRKRDELVVVYSGGCQEWQNIQEMCRAIKSTEVSAKYVFLSNDDNGMQARIVQNGIGDEVVVKSAKPSELPEYYEKAAFGFILRNADIVNYVACPTKLIEYLTYGVVPIVKSEAIGDFAKLGYKTLSLDAFIKGDLPHAQDLDVMRRENIRVLKKIARQVKQGETQILASASTCSRSGEKHKKNVFSPTKAHIYYTQLFLPRALGFSEVNSIRQSIENTTEQLVFELEKPEFLEHVRWDPANDACILKIKAIKVEEEAGETHAVENLENNAIYLDDRSWLFPTVDPNVIIHFPTELRVSKIHIYLEYISLGIETMYRILPLYDAGRKKLIEIEQERDSLKQERDSLKQERDSLTRERDWYAVQMKNILSSKSWRMTSLLRKIRRGIPL